MNKKISLGLCLSLILITIATTFAITMVMSKQIYNGIISNLSGRAQSYETAEEINRIISNYFYGSLDDYNSNLAGSVAEGYVNGLNDANSYYMTAAEYNDYLKRVEGETTGIGIETVYYGGKLIVAYVYEGSSAESVGLQKGDVITAVGNVTVTRSNYDMLRSYFTGDQLTSVKIEYTRDDITKVVEPINSFVIPTVTGIYYDDVGYVRISAFYKNTDRELKEILQGFKDSGIEKVVIDVRNTSDGTIEYAVRAIDVIVPNMNNGKIATIRDKDGKDTPYSSDSDSFTMSFAVLIDGNTKGPAELFACDMSEIRQAVLIGTTTAGVGTMQAVHTLSDGSAIMLTQGLVIPKNGESAVYDGVGLTPDQEKSVNDDSIILLLSKDEDEPLSYAISLLASQQ